MSNLIGQICVKLTGRESGRPCVIVDAIDNNFVLIDGNVKRRKCNINHLEFFNKKISITKGASTEQVQEAMKKLGINVTTKTGKEKNIEKTKEIKENKESKKEKRSKK